VISDASNLDDSADRLADRFRSDSKVSVVKRGGERAWVSHANLLLEESDTELFCWMPQDDLVLSSAYFENLVDALDRNPDRVLAFPSVCRRVKQGWLAGREPEPAPYRRPPIVLGSEPPDVEAVKLLRSWNMALGCWRGVFRRRLARPIPETADCPDLIWTFSLALEGNFVEVPEAGYLKRLHRDSALHSMAWQGAGTAEALYRAEVSSRMSRDPERGAQIMVEVRRHLRRHRFLRQEMAARRVGAALLGKPRPIYE
jgi:hypothetical protein